MKKISTLTLLLLALMLLPMGVGAQDVSFHPEPTAALGQKWQWAEDQADDFERGYWIGYSVERLMGEYSFIGSWSSRGRRMTLHEVLYGEKPEFDFRDRRHRRDRASERKVAKEVAVLFEFTPGAAQAREVHVTNVSGHVDFDGRPLLWLGGADDDESLDFVEQQFRRARSDDIKEDLILAVSIHDAPDRVVPILTDALTGDEADDVRESAAFWLGQHGDASALAVLRRTAHDDRSEDVREQAVFAISQMDLPDATEALIDLAQNGPRDIRKEAIFWLGQKASDRAVEALGDMVHDETDTEVQKQAVFAISQLPDDEGVPLLIEIAKTHPAAKVRKDAIFWLGQSDDPRALEALVALVRG